MQQKPKIMSQQNLSTQLEGLDDLQRFLISFQNRLIVLCDEYKRSLENLESAGVPSEVMETYFYTFRTANINTLTSINYDIMNLDVPYIKRVINEIRSAIDASRR